MIVFKQKTYSDEDRALVLSFLCRMEGWKTIARNFHWSSLSKSIHEYLEDLEGELREKQDEIAEVYQGLTDQRIGAGEVIAKTCECGGPLEFIDLIISQTLRFYEGVPETIEYCGLRSVIEELVAVGQKYRYLFRLCE